MSILIDTNLLVYLVDHHEPVKQARAKMVLDQLDLSRSGCLGAQNLAEFIHVVLRKLRPPLTPDEAWHQASLFASLWPVYDLTPQVVMEAARGVRDHSLPYYDAQVWAIARLNQVPVIFSEDFQDGMTMEGVRFVNPFSPGFDVNQWC